MVIGHSTVAAPFLPSRASICGRRMAPWVNCLLNLRSSLLIAGSVRAPRGAQRGPGVDAKLEKSSAVRCLGPLAWLPAAQDATKEGSARRGFRVRCDQLPNCSPRVCIRRGGASLRCAATCLSCSSPSLTLPRATHGSIRNAGIYYHESADHTRPKIKFFQLFHPAVLIKSQITRLPTWPAPAGQAGIKAAFNPP